MAKVSVSATMPVSAEKAWETASDLSRFDEWLTLHDGWRGRVPTEITAGTVLTSVVSVKGLRNRIDWAVGSFEPPALITLSGDGKAGVKVSLALAVRPERSGSAVSIDAEFSAPMLFGPLGSAVGRTLKGDLRTSLANLVTLIG
jgi:hypothetical protein